MKKLLFAFSIAGLLLAQTPLQAAMYLAGDGRGEALVFPYYTIDGGHQTLVSVVNTTSRGKAIKARFREGSNSRVVLTFNVYLAPFDVWTASIFDPRTADAAGLVTTDESCTVPAIKRNTLLPTLANGARYVPFSNAAYTGADNDSGDDSLARTREGHFEMIEMGEVTGQSLRAITAGANGVPLDCKRIENAWNPALTPDLAFWLRTDPTLDMAAPRGGLHGFAAMVDALGGTMLGYSAEAIAQFSGIVQHTGPLATTPNLASAGGENAVVEAIVLQSGSQLILRYPLAQAIDAVSALFTAHVISNDFAFGADIGGASEWVMSFPTKHFYTDLAEGQAVAPFANVFPRSGQLGKAPSTVAIDIWSRDGSLELCEPKSRSNAWDCQQFGGVPPPPAMDTNLSWVVNVLSIGQAQGGATQVLGSSRRLAGPATLFNNNGAAQGGSMAISFHSPWRDAGSYPVTHALRPDLNGVQLAGLPVVGFWVARYTNSAVIPGVLANYSAAIRHQVAQDLLPIPVPNQTTNTTSR